MISSEKKILSYGEWEDSAIERHDLYNFEAKIDYTAEESSKHKKTSYLLELYFFIPEVLQINRDSYTKDQFFLDLNNRIRFKTPQMSIEGILNKENQLSPIFRIIENLKQIEFGNITDKIKTRVEREIRLLACIIKVILRDQINYLVKDLQDLKKRCDLEKLIEDYIISLKDFQHKLDFLMTKFTKAQIPAKLRQSFQFSIEYISIQIEKYMTLVFKKVGREFSNKIQKKLIDIIETEQKRRRSFSERSLIKLEDTNETYSYYKGILKKYVQGVLYLDKKDKNPKSTSTQILYSVVEAVAMFFSLFLGFLFLDNFVEYSIPFIIAAVVIYMLKERIKDNAKAFSNKALGLIFPDERHEITDEFYNEQIGISKEKVRFLKWKEVPAGILKIRSSSNISSLEAKGKPEKVLFYNQKITLFNHEIDKIHTRKHNLSNILRFNIRQFLKYMDDPIEYISHWNNTTKEVHQMGIANVYHLNIVYKLTSFKGTEQEEIQFNKFRVILDQKGIKRVEEPQFIL
ncbi:MAG: hypothetical protein BAJALOKI1v1_700003 [Promethearchaeota archaeon]|nr:MAG: hypothetical protein BAJALOKI1v1_700003 [Candidatus Lokiarchaeota archaeon]